MTRGSRDFSPAGVAGFFAAQVPFPTADDLSVVDGVEATAKLHGGRQIGSQREAASQCLAVIPGEHRGVHAEVGGPALTLLVVEVADLVG